MTSIKNYMFAIIIFTAFITGIIALIGELNQSNPNFVDADQYEKFNKTFNKYDEAKANAEEIQNRIIAEGAKEENQFGVLGVLNNLILISWNILTSLFTSLEFMTVVFGGLYSMFGIPAWFGNMLISLTVLLIAFTIFKAVFQVPEL